MCSRVLRSSGERDVIVAAGCCLLERSMGLHKLVRPPRLLLRKHRDGNFICAVLACVE